MRKAKLLFFVILVFTILPLSAQLKYFAGAHGDVSIPTYYGTDKEWGFGGGGTLEAGVYLGNLSLAALGGFSYSADEGRLIESISEWKVGAEAGYDFDKSIIPFFPSWLAVRPNLAALVDFYKAEGYRSESKKYLGTKETSSGLSPVFEAGLLLDFPNLLKYRNFEFIPAVGWYETFRIENKGLFYSGRIALGMRVLFTPAKATGELNGGALNVSATTDKKLFSPNGDGNDDSVTFTVTSDADEHMGISNWELRIYDPGTKIFYNQKGRGKIPENFTWDGVGSNGQLVEGGCIYQYVWYVRANDGADGFIPGIVTTDVMVEEDDGVLHFSLSSIQFAPDAADFKGLTDEQLQRNKELFDTVARILKQYDNYNITVEGHANNVSGTEREHLKELLPLSQKRAETVKRELIARGIEAERLNAVGRGSDKMLTHKKDEIWKNRRVEFILTEKE